MSESNILSIDENQIREEIESFKLSIKFPKIKVPEEIHTIINLDRNQLNQRSVTDLAIDMVNLAQYALFLKTQINRYRSVLSWCEANINSIIGRELPNTSGYGFNEKSLQIKRNDPHAQKLVKIHTYASTKIQSIEDLDKKLEFISYAIKNLVYVKGGQHHGN